MTSHTPQTPPASGLSALLSIVQAVVALVPRWLVVATGILFLTWLGFDLYQKAEQTALQTENMRAQLKVTEAPVSNIEAEIQQEWREVSRNPEKLRKKCKEDYYDMLNERINYWAKTYCGDFPPPPCPTGYIQNEDHGCKSTRKRPLF